MACKRKKYLSEDVIRAVMAGDREAKGLTIEFYDRFICYLVNELIRQRHLNPDNAPVEDIQQEVRIRLLKALKKFK